MEDIILIKYLKEKDILNNHEYRNITSEIKDKVVGSYNSDIAHSDIYSEFFNNFKEVTKNMNSSEKSQFIDRLKDYDNKSTEHFNESYAKYIVSNMWHKDDTGRKYVGEKYDMFVAKEVCERYRGIISSSITYSDIYVAINSQYHDYSCLFKKWFGNEVDYKIIESAIIYWFKNEDTDSSKLWDYFNTK